jgi:hypothetical protein
MLKQTIPKKTKLKTYNKGVYPMRKFLFILAISVSPLVEAITRKKKIYGFLALVATKMKVQNSKKKIAGVLALAMFLLVFVASLLFTYTSARSATCEWSKLSTASFTPTSACSATCEWS